MAEVEKKKSDRSIEKKPSVWTEVQAAQRKDFPAPPNYKPQPQRDTLRLLSSEPSSSNQVREEEEPTDNNNKNNNNKKEGKNKKDSGSADNLADLKRKARERAARNYKEPGSQDESSMRNGKPRKDCKCITFVTLGVVFVFVLIVGLSIFFALRAAGKVNV